MVTKKLAGCAISDDKGRVLLIHRNTSRLTQWELPGGKVEPGELLAETAEREVLEEVGVQVKVGKEIGQANFVDDEIEWEYHWFEAEINEGSPSVKETEKFDGLGYFNLLDENLAQNMKLSPNIVNLITFLKKKSDPLKS